MKTKVFVQKYVMFLIFILITLTKQSYSQKSVNENGNSLTGKEKKLSFSYVVGLNYSFLLNYYDDYRIKSISNHVKNQRDVHTFHTEIQAYYLKRFGLALRYDYLGKKGESAIIDIGLPNLPIYANYNHSIYIHSIAPSLLFKTPFYNKSDLVLRAGLDYNLYKNPIVVDTEEFEASAKNTGIHMGISNVYKLNENFSLGINLMYRIGIINSIEITNNDGKQSVDLSGNDKININRITAGLSLGIH